MHLRNSYRTGPVRSGRFAYLFALVCSIAIIVSCSPHDTDCIESDPNCNFLLTYFTFNDIFNTSGQFNILTDSGQTSCASGASGDMVRMTCPQTIVGQDGDYPAAPNAFQLSVSDSGFTITDIVTGLVWERCSKGQTGTGCSGVASSTETQAQADSYCSTLTLAGRSWRLPSIRELTLFPDYEHANPAADDNDVNNYYPNQPGNASPDFFWSSTAHQTSPGNYFALDMRDGVINSQVSGSGRFVRCVSGTQYPDPIYVNNNNGTVYDRRSNLLWSQCSMDNTGTGTLLDFSAGCSGTTGTRQWVNAISDCENLMLAGRTDWRLPGIRELNNIVNFNSGASPYIDGSFFPNTSGIEYWSSTTSPLNDSSGMAVNFGDGLTATGAKTLFHRVRCVATGP
ncbi:MAG: DUF1566 domain-containing protein [Leptospiraceae bacterium]|nr:DUF1566 domain-containing protein [Leptospiraceae bacterium]